MNFDTVRFNKDAFDGTFYQFHNHLKRLKFTRLTAISLFLFVFNSSVFFEKSYAQLPAFPGAEGAGALVTGGRGTTAVPTTVFEVTNLSDDNNVGSLRYAVTQTSATYRTVVFRVSGTIHLTSALKFSKANTTIAGQTAPGDGICLADYPVSVSADNIIVRFIRFRMGDKNQKIDSANGLHSTISGDDDAFDGTGRSNIIIDHCTMSWSDDEACTFYGGDNVTLQWNIISEPLNYSYHFEQQDVASQMYENHGYGGIWGGRHASFHHNLLAHCQGRVPRFDGSRNLGDVVGAENVDFRNNVIYNWGSYNLNGGEGGNYNVVNNYYKYGPSTSAGSSGGVQIRYETLNPYKQTSPVLPYGKYYMDGNYVFGSVTNTTNNWKGAVMNSGTTADTAQSKVTTPFTLPNVTTQSATDAYELVLQNAGVTLPNRDTLDQRIVNDVRNGTGRIIDVQGGYPHGTPYGQTVNAWPALNATSAPADADHDGMPDTWESGHGSNPNDASDRNLTDANGYTKLENYLNSFTAGKVYPLTLTSFTGTRNGELVKLQWKTTNEKSVSNYTVERSNDKSLFKAIGKLKAINSAIDNQYNFTDVSGETGAVYYRLRMEDLDANYTYSNVVTFNARGNEKLTVTPNPVANSLTVFHAKAVTGAEMQILSVDGKLKLKQVVEADARQTTIRAEELHPGVYVLVFINDNIKTTAKFIKK